MNWKPKDKDVYRLSVVHCTMLANDDEEKCKFCGRYGCTDRGITILPSASGPSLNESMLAQQIIAKFDETIPQTWMKDHTRTVRCMEAQCVRKLKKSNAETIIAKIKGCGDDCRRNSDPCLFRDEQSICQRNVNPDGSTLICTPEDENYFDCPYHEQSFNQCYRRRDGQCTDLMEKYDATGKRDELVLLNHRFSAAPCRYANLGVCTHPESLHHEGICVLKGLMVTCEQYQPVDAESADTEGVFTVVSSKDGKDDRRIFPSSDYARSLSPTERYTLCLACRISHCIANLTGLKCLGVRRSTSNPFLNKANPLADHAIQINYLYLTHPEDLAKYDPELIAKAVLAGLALSCEGVKCKENQSCNFNPM